MRTISMPVFNRPDILSKVIERLSRCIGIEDVLLVIGVEPGNQQIADICRNITFTKTDITYHKSKRGPEGNAFFVMNRAFDLGSEFNTHLDDDVVVSPDALLLTKWYYETFKDQRSDLYKSFSLLNFTSDHTRKNTIICSERFYGLGFSCFADDFRNRFAPIWGKAATWDWAITNYLIDNKYQHLIPEWSRCNHIGTIGIDCNQAFQERVFTNLDWNTDEAHRDFILDSNTIMGKTIYWEE